MGQSPSPRVETQTARSGSMQKRVLAGGAVGQFIEFYDFSLYGLSALILATHFFPSGSTFTAMLATFATFGVAFLIRPLGGLFFGALGDRIGRRPVLFITLMGIGLATVGIGLMPSYSAIGFAAPVLLVFFRLIQGFSAGGESVGAPAFVLEHAPLERRGLWLGVTIGATALPGVLAGGLILGLNLLFGPDGYEEWAWRIPFLLALPLSVFGFWIRSRTEESPEFQKVLKSAEAKEYSPIREAFRTNGKRMVQVALVCGLMALSFYFLAGYFVSFLQTAGGLSRAQSLGLNAIVMALMATGAPLTGLIGDKVGRRPMLLAGSAGLAILVIPAFLLITSGNVGVALLGQLVYIIPLLVFGAGSSTIFVEIFQTKTRFTSAAVSYNVGYALLGGTAPLVGTWLVETTGSVVSPGVYLAVYAVIVFLVVRFGGIPETHPLLGKNRPEKTELVTQK
ncbi:MFS transporter [Arthrobacter sp.]|uniref:MFS transporter n=1 Tax=Arthrobacter sp. TaxID=1667 RepID=UPI0028991F4B|nr:MFS transporter [Arthrobacter sp.]